MTVWCDRVLVRAAAHIGLCTTEEIYIREMRRMQVHSHDRFIPKSAEGIVHTLENDKNGGLTVIVCVRPNKDRDKLIGYLVHESVHVWQIVSRDLTERNPSDEFEAYAIQNIFRQLLGKYVEQTTKPKPAKRKGKQ